MILDTTFLSALVKELRASRIGPARKFLGDNSERQYYTTVINVAELATLVTDTAAPTRYLRPFRILPLHVPAALKAGQIDRELIAVGQRMGEADTLIAGIACYNRQAIVSRDIAFDRVNGLRRIHHGN